MAASGTVSDVSSLTRVARDDSLLSPQTVRRCPACRMPCRVGVRASGVLVVNCPHDGVFPFGAAPDARVPAPGMDPEERLWLIERAITTLLSQPEDGDFVILQAFSLPCDYVTIRWNEGTVWAEVCSREWDCPYCGNRALEKGVRTSLVGRGFAGGGPHRNFERRGLGNDPRRLATLVEELLILAYGEPYDFAVAIYPSRSDVLLDLLAALRGTTAL
jgi:hypothetical protein